MPIDPAEKRKVFERLSSVRGIVFGVQDGVLTTAGVLCGLSGAVSDHKQVVLAALASTAAGALSMAVGAYLGSQAEADIVGAELAQAREEAEKHPYVIQESLLDQLGREGLARDAAYRVVKLLSSSPDALINTAEEKVYGLAGGLLGNPILDGIVAWIDCRRYSVNEAGDHDIVVGEVLELDVASEELPLLFFQGGYGRFAPATLANSSG